MTGWLKNKLNKIREDIERDNKEVHAHRGMDLVAFLLRAKNQVGSWYKQAKRTTNVVPFDMKTELLNSLGEEIHERIEIWTTTTQTTLKLCRQLGAITGLWEHKPTAFIGVPKTMKKKLNNVQEEFEDALKARKKPLAKHM